MRTDATITRRQIKLPHLVPTLGYDKWIAKPGDLILYAEVYSDQSESLRLARVIGPVSAPPQDEVPAIKDHLCVLAVSDDFTHAYERWIPPANVRRVLACAPSADFLTLFLGEHWPDATTLRRYGNGETTSQATFKRD